MATILKKRLDKLSEKIIGDYQCGFRKGRSTTDQIFMLKQSLIQRYEYNKPTHLLFIDFKSAYDSVHRRKMLKVLEKFDIPGKLIRLVKMTLEQTSSVVRVENQETEEFIVRKGLRQGDPVSALLFNLALEGVIRSSGINRQGTLNTKS